MDTLAHSLQRQRQRCGVCDPFARCVAPQVTGCVRKYRSGSVIALSLSALPSRFCPIRRSPTIRLTVCIVSLDVEMLRRGSGAWDPPPGQPARHQKVPDFVPSKIEHHWHCEREVRELVALAGAMDAPKKPYRPTQPTSFHTRLVCGQCVMSYWPSQMGSTNVFGGQPCR